MQTPYSSVAPVERNTALRKARAKTPHFEFSVTPYPREEAPLVFLKFRLDQKSAGYCSRMVNQPAILISRSCGTGPAVVQPDELRKRGSGTGKIKVPPKRRYSAC